MSKQNVVILFDKSSLSPYSNIFAFETQVTITAIGIQGDDYITFERVELEAGEMSSVCGCVLIKSGQPSIIGTAQLNCPTCEESEAPQPVRLTADNSIVVLDYPQGSALRAVYHGNGLQTREVYVTARETNTTNLTVELRGCPRGTIWEDTGATRCTDTMVQRQQVNSCGNYRWIDAYAVTWVDTGVQDCTGAFVVRQQVNDCGRLRWNTTTEAVDWEDTGTYRCTGEFVERQQTNQCGAVRWQVSTEAVEWTDTGVSRCGATFVQRQQTNQCGRLRWVDTIEVVAWVDKCQVRCNEGAEEMLQENQCGQLRWELTGFPCEAAAILYNVVITPVDAIITGGENACYTVTLDQPAQIQLDLDLALIGSEQDWYDYPPSQAFTIAAGQTSVQVCVATVAGDPGDRDRVLTASLLANGSIDEVQSGSITVER